jgi:hypothetical protein
VTAIHRLALAAAFVLLASGCATITKGQAQTVTVNTDPAGATCTLSRDGATIAVVNPTPGSISIGKASGAISVLCRKTGYQDASGALAASFQAMTFGNILLGGIIGIAVDAASGAMHEYPPMVTITLVPDEFETAAARDEFFARMVKTLDTETDELRERIRKQCTSDCEAQLKAVDEGAVRQKQEIESRRASARVRKP